MSRYLNFPKQILHSDEELFPNHTQEALERYFVHGLLPGSFVEAVLVNDLYSAATKADHWNKQRLAAIAQWIVFNAPRGSYGSWEAVEAWLEDRNSCRTKWLEQREKEISWDTLKDTIDKDMSF